MIIVYSSNTGYTKQYADMLGLKLDMQVYNLKDVPTLLEGCDAIYLGWIFAGSIVGYRKAAGLYHVKCVIGVGMSPESAEQTAFIAEKSGAGAGAKVFYLQGGYDFNKLTGFNKLAMKIKTKEILGRFENMSDAEKEANATYRMVTRGDSVVSKERLEPVVKWLKDTRVIK